jgi:hypothetical protein
MRFSSPSTRVARLSLVLAVGFLLTLAVSSIYAASSASPASSNSNSNNSNGNSSNGNGNSSNGNGNSSNGNGNNNNGNGNVSSVAPSGSTSATLGSTNPTVSSPDGQVTLHWTSGGDVKVTAGPGSPSGITTGQSIHAWSLELGPMDVPNDVTLTATYTATDLATLTQQAPKGNVFRLMYWSRSSNTWVELPTTQDLTNHTLTVTNLDLSPFSGGITQLAIVVSPA